jgi:alkylation response protein AidB-like acyl-CoA dehydrogenase
MLMNSKLLEQTVTDNSVIAELKTVIAQELAPHVRAIDVHGEYPRAFMHQVGAIGGFGQAVPSRYGGSASSLKGSVQSIEAIAKECLSTGFITWCQIACTWYIQNSENEYLKQNILPPIAKGERLAGTGLSNPMKHFAGIEKIALVAERCAGGYVLNGLLPWVSNVGAGHYFAVAAKMSDGPEDTYLMAIVSDEFKGLTLRADAHFIALEGSNTFSCGFKNVFVPDQFILAAPCEEYVARIRPGFMLTQVGMGLGLVASCIELMKRANRRLQHVNCFLDDQAGDLEAELEALRLKTYALADALTAQDTQDSLEKTSGKNLLREVIQARIAASELSLRASNAAMLHVGARGYLQGSTAERKLRESYFVAIVTPALKHLKKMLYGMSEA